MRTTIHPDDRLAQEAARLSGVREKTSLVHRGFALLIARKKARRLALLEGTMPGFKPGGRRRPRPR
jgi:Arc/MetJ family transcription regulator